MVQRCVLGGLVTFLLFQPKHTFWEFKRTVFTQLENCVLGIQKNTVKPVLSKRSRDNPKSLA